MRTKDIRYPYQELNEARDILMSIGMPEKLYNPRCVLVFAVCAGVYGGGKWKNVSEGYHGTHEIIALINTHYPGKAGLDVQGYQENSRETFRKSTLQPWEDAGIMERKPGLPVNSKDNAYRFTSQFASLVRKFGTREWEDNLRSYNETHESYESLLKQAKALDPGLPVNYNGLTFTLGRSPHNRLQKEVLEKFAPYFAPGAELLYIGDTSDKNLHIKKDRLAALGVDVFADSGRLPDIVLYDSSKKRILFIEAYNSTGEFTLGRVNELKANCHCAPDMEVAFVTAFETMKKASQKLKDIAWDTDIWVAENDTHLIHKNGDRFMGRPL